MTLITHFKTEKYAVIIGDGYEEDDNRIGKDCKKIIAINENTLVGTYGFVKEVTDDFLVNWDCDLKKLEEHISRCYSDNLNYPAGIGITVVTRDKTYFVIKSRSLNSVAIFENINFKNYNYDEPEGTINDYKNHKQLCENQYFFGTDYGSNIDWEHQRKIFFEFYDVCIDVFKTHNLDNYIKCFTISKIKKVALKFYKDTIYLNGNLNRSNSISGQIQLGIIEIKTGKIVFFETIYTPKT